MKARFFYILVSAPLVASAVQAEVPARVTTCQACHGTAGISPNEQWPNLAHQKRGYLSEQLKNFRDGTRANSLMTPIAKMLSDQDIDELAAYYASVVP